MDISGRDVNTSRLGHTGMSMVRVRIWVTICMDISGRDVDTSRLGHSGMLRLKTQLSNKTNLQYVIKDDQETSLHHVHDCVYSEHIGGHSR